MQKLDLQTLISFSLGLTVGVCVGFSITTFLSVIVALFAMFIYAIRYAKGLKYNQGKWFTTVSVILYFGALMFSLHAALVWILFVSYEILNEKSFESMVSKNFPFVVVTFVGIICRCCFLL